MLLDQTGVEHVLVLADLGGVGVVLDPLRRDDAPHDQLFPPEGPGGDNALALEAHGAQLISFRHRSTRLGGVAAKTGYEARKEKVGWGSLAWPGMHDLHVRARDLTPA